MPSRDRDQQERGSVMRVARHIAEAPARHKALIRRFYDEVWAKGNLAVTDEVFHDDYVRHDLRPGQALPGAAGQAKIATDFRQAFPDVDWHVDLLIADDQFVVGRWTASGTHLGSWAGMEPTGKAVTFFGVNIFRFHDEKVAEIWNHRDDLGLMTQLGAPSYAGAAGAAGPGGANRSG